MRDVEKTSRDVSKSILKLNDPLQEVHIKRKKKTRYKNLQKAKIYLGLCLSHRVERATNSCVDLTVSRAWRHFHLLRCYLDACTGSNMSNIEVRVEWVSDDSRLEVGRKLQNL